MARDGAIDPLQYLRRIGLSEAPTVDVRGLELLQRAHLTAVPFENLDVYARRGVETSLDWSLPKIVERRRGGWCFELNGAFSSLLTDLGFDVRHRGATVLLQPGSGYVSHLALEVTLDVPYLVDVGFGDTFIKPLRLDLREPQDGGSGVFLITADGDFSTLFLVEEHGSHTPQYRLEPSQWHLEDFDSASERLQTDPSGSWTEKRFATRLLKSGPDRVTLLQERIKFRIDGEWTERLVAAEDWEAELSRWFGMAP
ncbi:MAG: arylamine N-acetyltransferase [Actinomycetia bacterium]|nr:arylamine N-acetyltransferase [Actinomycetes bacterium]